MHKSEAFSVHLKMYLYRVFHVTVMFNVLMAQRFGDQVFIKHKDEDVPDEDLMVEALSY